MNTWAAARAAHVVRLAAAVAFWAAAVIFVTAVSALSGWLPDEAVVSAPTSTPPQGVVTAPPSPVTPAETTLDGGGMVTFPGSAERSERPVDVSGTETTLVTYSAREGDVTYTVGVIEYPPHVRLADPAVNLIASVSGAAGNVGGRVLDQRITTYQRLPAVEFTVEAGGVRLEGRNVLVGRRLYLQNVAFGAGRRPDALDDFFGSFEPPPS